MNGRRSFRAAVVVMAVGAALGLSPGAGVADTNPCAGGTLPSGSYTSLHIATTCQFVGKVSVNGGLTIDTGGIVTASGGLRVNGALTLAPQSRLDIGGPFRENGPIIVGPGSRLAALSPATVRENGRITVGAGSVLEFRCDQFIGKCAPKSDFSFNGGIVATDTLSVDLEGVRVNGGVSIAGGEYSYCFSTSLIGNRINGRVSVSGVQGCDLTVSSNRINGPVEYTDNTDLGSGNGNVISDNNINGGLACSGNAPAAHGTGNLVNGPKTGECASV